MDDRELAISILQKARDALSERLTERILESRQEIAEDAEGGSYMSEIEAIYEQLGGRLAHLNAMLANLPPESEPATPEPTASEIVYADLASSVSSGLDIESSPSMPLLALPAPAAEALPLAESLADELAAIVFSTQSGDLASAAGLISELFDLKPSQARRAAQAFARQVVGYPSLARRIAELGRRLSETNEYAGADTAGRVLRVSSDRSPGDHPRLALAVCRRGIEPAVVARSCRVPTAANLLSRRHAHGQKSQEEARRSAPAVAKAASATFRRAQADGRSR